MKKYDTDIELRFYDMKKESDRKQYAEDREYKKLERLLNKFVDEVINSKILNYDKYIGQIRKIIRKEMK